MVEWRFPILLIPIHWNMKLFLSSKKALNEDFHEKNIILLLIDLKFDFTTLHKFLSAYSLLVEEPDPCKEKGYVSSLYAGIKRCLPDKHIHLQMKTEYITQLISRAEPELLGR